MKFKKGGLACWAILEIWYYMIRCDPMWCSTVWPIWWNTVWEVFLCPFYVWTWTQCLIYWSSKTVVSACRSPETRPMARHTPPKALSRHEWWTWCSAWSQSTTTWDAAVMFCNEKLCLALVLPPHMQPIRKLLHRAFSSSIIIKCTCHSQISVWKCSTIL